MKSLIFVSSILILVFSSFCFSQDPLPVVRSTWEPAVQKARKGDTPQTGPAKQITGDDTMIARTNREFSTDHPDNPSDLSPDGRRSSIEAIEQQANSAQMSDVKGFVYKATVHNESTKPVKVIFWEYKFTERADPKNVVRRQFLCSVNIKPGAEFDLSAFSTLGPTGSISAKSVAPADKLFEESVRVNRIEYSDDDIMQRGDWKFADVKTAVERVTAKPWGKEICRPL